PYWRAICEAAGALSSQFDDTGLDPTPPNATAETPLGQGIPHDVAAGPRLTQHRGATQIRIPGGARRTSTLTPLRL
ncbi:MAG: hypothetical protein WB735_13500, partial [Pseudonocardiaceae bacterium]